MMPAKQEVLPVLEQMPIQFSHRVIMSCIEEIKLRGLRHPHLFRNPFHGASVEAALSMLAHPQKAHLFSVKMMRIDTVAGLLTTALSRTYPPLLPPHIQEMFQNPNGRFFFELLGMLPELNRYLFVEILDVCCALVDNQQHNQISHSKLAVFPGSCCFGLNEYMPNWDTRYLMSADLRRFSSAFYHAIYAYREERDLTEVELQGKLEQRARVMEMERQGALEREHGYRGAQAILRMEARIAQGLPAESPTTMREISLYSDRKEKVVADDAISLFDMELDDGEEGVARVPDLDCVAEMDEEESEEEEENVQLVLKDLRRSKSVASLGGSRYENQPRSSTPLGMSPASGPNAAAASSGYLPQQRNQQQQYHQQQYHPQNGYLSPTSSAMSTSPMSPTHGASLLSRSNTLARSVSLKFHPVSPGDIFGISQRAVEKRELEGFLAAARTTITQKKVVSRKRSMQRRQMSKMRTLAGVEPHKTTIRAPMPPATMPAARRQQRDGSHATATPSSDSQAMLPPPSATIAASILRRKRSKEIRKALADYLDKGLTFDEALQAREADLKKQKRKAKRAQQKALAKAEAEREAAAAVAIADAISQRGWNHGGEASKTDLTEEEAEILEAFDYLSDAEFQEFMDLAGLTMEDVQAIRDRSVAMSVSKVAEDIVKGPVHVPVAAAVAAALADEDVVVPRAAYNNDSSSSSLEGDDEEMLIRHQHRRRQMSTVPEMSTSSGPRVEPRPFKIPHMTSMDLLFKHASVVGDANLRLYPTRPSSPTISDYESDSMHGGLLSRAASVMRKHHHVSGDCDDDEDEESNKSPALASISAAALRYSMPSSGAAMPSIPYSTRPVSKTIPYASAPVQINHRQEPQEMVLNAPQQQMNNHQHHKQLQNVAATAVAASIPALIPSASSQVGQFEFQTVADYSDEEDVYYEEEESVVVFVPGYQQQTAPVVQQVEETEEEAELRELLESMSEEERSEFLRLSHQDTPIMSNSMSQGVLVGGR
ncbi:hypothetical protein BGZ95_007994 [Linnemannia exigua]|uniref:Rho-GAP domain-containing protein n=1 Tax=Linnemannia exigua TaxID=604196 RepID=A0AAD4H7J8_9FUNG|nr:hypothetical protein BGZ95_007994 [Linnemannia exigua]